MLALAALTVRAEDKRDMFNPINTSVTSQSIAPDARAAGFGDVGAATEADVNSQYWNPAKYPFSISRAGVGLNYTPWLRQLTWTLPTFQASIASATTAPYQALCAISHWARSISISTISAKIT